MVTSLKCIAVALLLTGCGTSMQDIIGFDKMIEALGKDNATLCLKAIGGPYIITLQRTNAKDVKVKCKNDEMEVEPLSK